MSKAVQVLPAFVGKQNTLGSYNIDWFVYGISIAASKSFGKSTEH